MEIKKDIPKKQFEKKKEGWNFIILIYLYIKVKTMNIKKIIREELEKIMEVRNPLMNYLKGVLPNVPEYVLQDFFYSNLKNATKEDVTICLMSQIIIRHY